MKKQQNNSTRPSALQIILSIALLSISAAAILFGSGVFAADQHGTNVNRVSDNTAAYFGRTTDNIGWPSACAAYIHRRWCVVQNTGPNDRITRRNSIAYTHAVAFTHTVELLLRRRLTAQGWRQNRFDCPDESAQPNGACG